MCTPVVDIAALRQYRHYLAPSKRLVIRAAMISANSKDFSIVDSAHLNAIRLRLSK